MRIRTRFLCFLLAALMVCAALFSAGAAKTVTMTAVNNSFLPLSSSTMPSRQNGEYYVPYSVFSGSLGLRASSDNQSLSLSSGGTTLTFNTAQGTTYDQNMNSYSSPAYFINGTTYVPVRLVCGRFGFSYSTLTSGDSLILRICSGSALSDSEFLAQNASTIQTMRNNYLGISAPSNANGQTGTTTQPTTPAQPTILPQKRPSSISFAVTGAPNNATSALLDAFAHASCAPVFFLPTVPESYSNEMLREIAVKGYEFGFLVSHDMANPEAKLTEANAALFRATGLTSRLLLIDGGADALTQAERDTFINAGYRLWDSTFQISPNSRAAAAVKELTAAFITTSNAVVVQLPYTEAAAQIVTQTADFMHQNAIPAGTITLLTTPRNRAQDRR